MFGSILGFGLVVISASISASVTALHCYQCLQLDSESLQLRRSIQLSMTQLSLARRHHLEFNPNVTCPTGDYDNVTIWSPYSFQCQKSDSVCLQARVEVLTSFSGLRDNLALDRFSEVWSKGYVRACANRRVLLGLPEPTVEVKDDQANSTLTLTFDLTPNKKFTLTEIFFHHFYVDHGTSDAIKCLQDNCNARRPPGNGGTMRVANFPAISLLLLGLTVRWRMRRR